MIDDAQSDDVFHQWSVNGVSAWKIPLLQTILARASFSGKPSTPWSPDGVQDFMHAKVVVADDVSFVGSFNFSRSGERNAENVLEIHDAGVADTLAAYVDGVRARYPPAIAPASPAPARRGRSPATAESRRHDVRRETDNPHMIAQASTPGPLGQPRGIGFAILQTIVTLGIYTLYWVFKTQDEVKEHSGIGVGGVVGARDLHRPLARHVVPGSLRSREEHRVQGRRPPGAVHGLDRLWFLLPILGAFVWFFKVRVRSTATG